MMYRKHCMTIQIGQSHCSTESYFFTHQSDCSTESFFVSALKSRDTVLGAMDDKTQGSI